MALTWKKDGEKRYTAKKDTQVKEIIGFSLHTVSVIIRKMY